MKNPSASNCRALGPLLIIMLLLSCCGKRHDAGMASLYDEIDREMELSPLYQQEKEKRIALLRNQLTGGRNPELDMAAADRLIEEYESYQSDSALRYVNLNLENPLALRNKKTTLRLLIKKADILSHAGLFGEALEILDHVALQPLDSTLLEPYYATRASLYQYQCEYATNSEYAEENAQLRDIYTDSVIRVAPPSSMSHIVAWASSGAREENPEAVRDTLLQKLGELQPGDRDYSIIASILAYIYKETGNTDDYHRYLALSTISDLKGVVKENMAIRELATASFEDGDLERANRYLKQSFADANFYAARMRNAQSSKILPVIDEAYNASQRKMHRRLTVSIIFISVLAAVLFVLMWFAIKQMRKVAGAKEAIGRSLREQEVLSDRLKTLNGELAQANSRLKASNILREEYAGLFMEYCSLAISGLQHYHQSLKVMANTGNMKGLLKKIDSTDIVNKTLHDFYDKFDEAILNLYPDFVTKFNALLKPGEEITLKPGEKLNNELRIFALIRIGINDSEKIAQFLRCSLATVYTYRSRIKKRAQDPASFESALLSLF